MAVILKAAMDILQQMSMVTQYSDLKTKKTCKNMSNDATKLEKSAFTKCNEIFSEHKK